MSHHTSLECWKGGALQSSITLVPDRTYTVGRSEDADVPCEHPSVSRRHAELTVDGGGIVSVRDLGSAQGTFVDGVELAPSDKPRALRDLATLRFGCSSRSYLVKAPAAATAAAGSSSSGSQFTKLEKRKLLWAGKQSSSGNAAAWSEAARALDGDRGERFKSLLGVKRHRAEEEEEPSAGRRQAGADESADGQQQQQQSAQQKQQQMFDELERQYEQARALTAARR